MTSQFLEALVYISCKLNPGMYMVWGIPVQAQYVPFVHVLMNLFMGQSIIPDIIGILAGHCYYFLKVVCPRNYGKDYLPTPRFLTRWFHEEPGRPQQPQVQHPQFNPFAGRGHAVG